MIEQIIIKRKDILKIDIPQYEYIKLSTVDGLEYEGNLLEIKNNYLSFYTIPYTSEVQTLYLDCINYLVFPQKNKAFFIVDID